MRKAHFPWILAIILLGGFIFGHILGLVLAALGLFVSYLISLRLHPRIRHTGWNSCNGSGEIRGSVFTWSFRKCPRCNGGRLVRWGAGLWGAEHVRSERRRTSEARAAARDGHRWR